MAVLSVAIFALFALGGLIAFNWYVSGKTNYRLSGWAAYFAITAIPSIAVWSVFMATVAVLWREVS